MFTYNYNDDNFGGIDQDEDYLLALKLQEQEQELFIRNQNQNQEKNNKKSGNSSEEKSSTSSSSSSSSSPSPSPSPSSSSSLDTNSDSEQSGNGTTSDEESIFQTKKEKKNKELDHHKSGFGDSLKPQPEEGSKHQKDKDNFHMTTTNTNFFNENDQDEDFKLALKLQQQEQELFLMSQKQKQKPKKKTFQNQNEKNNKKSGDSSEEKSSSSSGNSSYSDTSPDSEESGNEKTYDNYDIFQNKEDEDFRKSQILAWQLRQTELNRQQQTYYCVLCEEEHPNIEYLQLSCSHKMCPERAQIYILEMTEQKKDLNCPGCKKIKVTTPIEPIDLEQLGIDKQEAQDLFLSLLVKRNPTHYCYCPNPNCLKVMEHQQNLRIQCPYCQSVFCRSCLVEWHEGLTCDEYYNQKSFGDGLFNMVMKKPEIVDFIISTAYIAINSPRSQDIVNPFPVMFENNNKRNVNALKTCINSLPSVDEMQRAKSEIDLRQILENANTNCYQFLRWLIVTNKLEIEKIHPNNQIQQFQTQEQWKLVSPNKDREQLFTQKKNEVGRSLFCFHGSPAENWYCIMRIGLKNYSRTKFQLHGAARGAGIYLAQNPHTSRGYCKTKNNWPRSILKKKTFHCIAMCEVIPDGSFNKGAVMVVKNENLVRIRCLFVNFNNLPTIPTNSDEVHQKLNQIFGHDPQRYGFDYINNPNNRIIRQNRTNTYKRKNRNINNTFNRKY
ncbi:poly adp-ribose polymerase family member parp [Anaeramoeba flamelloides]|uniref:Poly adp-ribose polymerase family member parp n=1 Tax=Anaeramoeba flamelloides TaxID=1746091 RepID=A0AAV7YHK3_9EUKA|nr:poly adp-ribose polymerase family member parp [Anaeramoeba flamelloides]